MAKRFRFRLEVVLKLRKQKQDECRRVVAARLRQIAAVQTRIDRMSEDLDHQRVVQRRLVGPQAAGADSVDGRPALLDLTGIRRHRHYVTRLLQNIAAAERQLAELRTELRREQAALEEASREVKVIEKLEEKQRQRHNLVLARAERAEADEIGAQFVRSHGLAGGAFLVAGES